MAIQPLELVEAIVDEYRDHLETEFRARDPQLQQALVEPSSARASWAGKYVSCG